MTTSLKWITVCEDNRLTQETSNALHVTLHGMVDLTRALLSLSYHKYVLPGNIQSDRIETEFVIYRQSSGGNYEFHGTSL